MSDTTLIKDISINGNTELKNTSDLSKTLQDNTINALGVDASSRTIWINGQPYGNAYVNIKDRNTIEAPLGAEIFNDFAHNVASGEYSHAEGSDTTALGDSSHTEGNNTTAGGSCSHAEGVDTTASQDNSHAEGDSTTASGYASHAEGDSTTASGDNSHAEGYNTTASGDYSHASGFNTIASGKSSFTIGQYNEAISENSVAMGNNNIAGLKGWYYGSINKINDNTIDVYISDSQMRDPDYPTWGGTTILSNLNPYEVLGVDKIVSLVNDAKYDNEFKVIGGEAGRIRLQTVSGNLPFSSISIEELLDPEDYSIYCISMPTAGVADMGQDSFVSGYNSKATNGKAVAFGYNNHAYGKFSFVEGRDSEAGYASHAEGRATHATGDQSHSEGRNTWATGDASHAEGSSSGAAGRYSHAEGGTTHAYGEGSHSEGLGTNANTKASHAEGDGTSATGIGSHAEGVRTTTLKDAAHAEGAETHAEEWATHAEGYATRAVGYGSHTEGDHTIANNPYEHASGRWNKSNDGTILEQKTLFSVGIGSAGTTEEPDKNRKNAHEILTDGRQYIYEVGGYDGTNPDTSYDIATYLPNMVDIKYSELKDLRDNNILVPGQQYRITDYKTTVADKLFTKAEEHQFDIIVTADDESMLNEVGRACYHEFDLEKYKDAYSSSKLDSSEERMLYIGISEYRDKEYYLYESESQNLLMLMDFNKSNALKQEFVGTEYPYSFVPAYARRRNGMWVAGQVLGESIKFKYNLAEDTYFFDSNLAAWKIWYCLDNDTERFAWADEESGKGVIYRMIDEWNNDVPYDFKNIIYVDPIGFRYAERGSNYVFARNTSLDKSIDGVQYYGYTADAQSSAWSSKDCWLTDESPTTSSTMYNDDGTVISYVGSIVSVNDELKEYYTFGSTYGDYSILDTENVPNLRRCISNVIGAYINTDAQQHLNKIYFGPSAERNTFGQNCFNNRFDMDCHNNIFEPDCDDNIFGAHCYNNVFGPSCFNNSFGANCSRNSFGASCNRNSFGASCGDNCFGNVCLYNSFGSGFNYNSFGNNCEYNSFGSGCGSNSFGNKCSSNSFGNYCNSNSFGNNCNYNSFRSLADNVSPLISYCSYNHFDDRCSYNVIWNSGTMDGDVLLKNINVNKGVCGTSSSYNYINITTLNSEQEINVNQVDGIVSVGDILSIRYESLKTLRDNSQLIPGRQYRIIDYETTVADKLHAISAGHQFDIIITADDEKTLNEVARACLHEFDLEKYKDAYSDTWQERMLYVGIYEYEDKEYHLYESEAQDLQMLMDFNTSNVSKEIYAGDYQYSFLPAYVRLKEEDWAEWITGDTIGNTIEFKYNLAEDTYFFDSNLAIWKIWYCLDNDTTRFDWADTLNGKGVIYRMIDEWNNDVPYDFKNIRFIRYKLKTPSITSTNDHKYVAQARQNIIAQFSDTAPQLSYIWGGFVIFGRTWIPDTELRSEYAGTYDYFYTFSDYKDGLVLDKSLYNKCYSNTIKEYINTDNKLTLNDIVFFNTVGNQNCCNTLNKNCYGNNFGDGCEGNIFGDKCTGNVFGDSCEYNNFGNKCNYNIFGLSCYSNSLGNGCNRNSFGNICYNNIFGNSCYSNSFGNNCQQNSFGNECNYNCFVESNGNNMFGSCCYSNSLDTYCSSNSFSSICNNNIFGQSCSYNSFGNYCESNRFGNNCSYNSFGNDCTSNIFGQNCSHNSFENDCEYNSFRTGENSTSLLRGHCSYNHFDAGCSYIILYSLITGDTTSKLQNYNINRGVRGSSDDFEPILVAALNNKYEIQVARKSDGNIIQYCAANNVTPLSDQ